MADMATVQTLADEVSALAMRAEREACREAESQALCGEYGEPSPYDALLAELELARMAIFSAVQNVTFLKTHLHKWGEDDRCIHCRADGRA